MTATVPFRANSDLLDTQYTAWKKDPSSVDASWAAFFEGFELGLVELTKRQAKTDTATGGAGGTLSEKTLSFRMRVTNALLVFRSLGHTASHLDPLSAAAPNPPTLTLEGLGFTEDELDEEVKTHMFRGGQPMKLREMLSELRKIYCGQTGYEFMHIHTPEVQNWLLDRVEKRPFEPELPAEQQVDALRWLLEAETFERFLHRRYVGQKRFSVEGGESLLVALETILESLPRLGASEIVMGMAHRGRLSVLANFLRKPLENLFYEFSENYVPNMVAGDGDVKYHLGFETVRKTRDGKEIAVMLAPNPSHLEAVDPVVEGMTRARQRMLGDTVDRKSVIPVLIHGDAAFAGQGIVTEVLNLSQLPGYRTGGTIHIVVNNQIGFTTLPADARSTTYCTDVAKMVDAPIIHVNGDCPLEVAHAAKLAIEFRQMFGRDVVIDIVCYRRYGHNETDEPAFTQPNMARAIASHPSTATIYRNLLVEKGVLDESGANALQKELEDELEDGVKTLAERESKIGENPYEGSTAESQPPFSFEPTLTGVEEAKLKEIGEKLLQAPESFHLHPTISRRFLAARKKAIESGEGFDWAYAESLAFGSLLTEGLGVRLSGQDVRRGTFSQRHCVFYDTETRERHIPLTKLSEDQGRFCVYNSLLSEAAVLGFDYGYTLLAPNVLICWEAQFGDFVNGAQVIIDQFIASAESKWQRPSQITLLLPHGYEGQGPEHSSARLERFLQLSAGRNWQVCNFTTPAQYFHALRRQMKRGFRKPLIVMTPKSLLRHPKCVSKLSDMAEGTSFNEILDDEHLLGPAERVTRLILCSGKVYYDLLEFREQNKIKNAAIIRIEQLYPLHEEKLKEIVARYPRAQKKWVWCQEEPRNMGAFGYIRNRLSDISGHRVRYAGRERSSSPAAGSKAIHVLEQEKLVEDAFSV
ncbi:2-oxoglutarate dehydrogenase E1 component [Prosthecobacter debontii]|uniref:oxoglutarate dehydrogenase (succinyl-transferring) n=1 Tax=Prosthecobacter debontii TaxID=48467 RepID=A0A1T4YQ36_9BACT|nr:2-oxoglutarate dehydrogenase E1 component [Prosthecobacter debontii]SKB03830.1 2-oxoglutarate dehydrogenase E1 component [Prosthecobacter debontii]